MEMNDENINELNPDLNLNRINAISEHEKVLATKYLSRYRSFYGRIHSPRNFHQYKQRSICIYLDEYNLEENSNSKRKNLKNSGEESNIIDLLSNIKNRLNSIREEIQIINEYKSFCENKQKIENILDESKIVNSQIEELKNNEHILTKKLALIKNSFKNSIVRYKKIERELYRNRFFWQELQIGIAPAINNNFLKKRKQIIVEEREKSSYKKKAVDNSLSQNQNSIIINSEDEYSKNENNSCKNSNISKNAINSINNSYYNSLRDFDKSESNENSFAMNEVPHNSIASENVTNNNIELHLEQIDNEVYRDGLNFHNLLNFKNLLLSYIQQTPYQVLNNFQIMDNENNFEKIADTILNKRRSYVEDFTRKLELSGVNLDIQRSLYIKKSRLFRHQQNSKYNDMNTLSALQSYTILNMIGKGGFAEVWEVLNMNTWNITAAKIHELTPDMTEHERMVCVERVSNEIKLHRDLKHPNIVNMLHCFEIDNDRLVTIMELCDGPDLDTFIKTNGYIPEELAIIWIRQILEGILYLNNIDKNGERLSSQRNPIIHYDLKPGNIILHRGCCKIADFGLSKMVDPISGNVVIERIGGGTVWYQPPEILIRPGESIDTPRIISHKVDIWAIGCIFYEILHLRRPFGLRSSSIAEAFSIIPLEAEKGAIFDENISSECKSYINWLLTYNHDQRPDIIQAYSHPLIQNIINK